MLNFKSTLCLLIVFLAFNNASWSDEECCGGEDQSLIGIKVPDSGRYGPYTNTSLKPAHAYSPHSDQDAQYLKGALPDTPVVPYDDSKILIKFSLSYAKGAFWDKFKHEGIAKIKPMFEKRDVEKMAMPIPGEKPNIDLWRWTEAFVEHPIDVEELVKELNALPEVQIAQVDYEYKLAVPDGGPNVDAKIQDLPTSETDAKFSEMWHLEKIQEEVPWAEYSAPLKIKELWQELENRDLPPGGSPDVVIAIIDTGVDYNHPDLKQNMWINGGEIAGNGIDDDANGFVDDVHGVNVVSDERFHSGDPDDDHGHGTHVAGIAAAAGHNKIGVVGVAYSSKIMAIKAAQYSGNLTSSDIAEALYYAIQNGADVINMSFAQRVRSPVVEDALAVAFRNAVLVAAAGNYDKGLDPGKCQAHGGYYNRYLNAFYPAAYNWVIGVEARAVKSWGYKPGKSRPKWHTRFSNHDCARNSKYEYEVRAPGDNIWSTFPGKQQYISWDGTSMAAPMISGMAALLRTAWPDKARINSRFIMGQISSTAHLRDEVYDKTPEVLDRLKGQPYYGVPDAHLALTKVPVPNLYLLDYWIFDKPDVSAINDDDGRVDSGETIDLAIELKNSWGKATDITLSMTAQAKGAAGPDPYVEIITKEVSYSPMGPFSRSDNGLVYDKEGKITGIINPVRFKVSPDCPNDHLIPITLTITSKNGLGPKDGFTEDLNTYTYIQRFSVFVQRGKEVPRVISRDTTLTKDFFWIINQPTLIEAGKTLTVGPGTQIQWGAPTVKKVYEWDFRAKLQAEGTFLVQGTAEEPVELFPSEFHECYTMMNGNLQMSHVKITNPYMAGMDVKTAKAKGFPTERDSYIDHGLIRENNICFWRWIEMPTISNTLIDYKLGEFIAPQGLKLGMRYNEAFKHWFWAQNIKGSVFEHGRGPFGTDAANTCRGVSYGVRPPSKVEDTVFLQNHIRDEFGLSSIYWFNANSYKKGEFSNLLVTDNEMATEFNNNVAPIIENLVSHDGKTYGVINTKMWSDPGLNGFYQLQVAQSAAAHYKGNVLTINDKAENDFILSYIDKNYPGKKLGIGLSDILSEGTFSWSSEEGATYRNWFPGDANIKYTDDAISPWPWDVSIGETDSIIDYTGSSEINNLVNDNLNSRYRSGKAGFAEFTVNLKRPIKTQQFKISSSSNGNRNVDPTSFELYGKTDYKIPGDENTLFSEDFEGLTLGARVDEPNTADEVVVPLGSITIREYWYNKEGNRFGYDLASFKDSGMLISPNPNFPNAILEGTPDFEGAANMLEWPAGDPDNPSTVPSYYASGRDHQGWQAIGYLHPPITGEYKFYLAADEFAEVWLSTDDSASNAIKIAELTNRSSLREFRESHNSSGISDLITLEKGKRYYLEVIAKDNWSQDYMAVAWKIPGGDEPGYRGSPILGKYLQPMTEKLDKYVAYKEGEKVWTKSGPSGWSIDDTSVPGAGNPDKDGVTEWAGWSFPNKDFWAGAGGGLRSGFSKGINNIAVADGDAWADDTSREHGPVAKKINNIEVYMHQTSPRVVDLSGVFSDQDPEDDNSEIVKSILSISDDSIATATLAGDDLTVEFKNAVRGESLISIKGVSDGLFAVATLKVIIKDSAPYVDWQNQPSNITVNHSSADTIIDLSKTFKDRENDPIVLSVHNNTNKKVVQASIDGTNLKLDYQPNEAGEGYVQIKATANGLGAYVTQRFYVLDTAPVAVRGLPSLNVKSEGTVSSVDLTGLFSDAEGDPITLSVASNSRESLLSTLIDGNTLKINYKDGVFGAADLVIRGTANNKSVDYTLAISRGVPFVAKQIEGQRFDTSSVPQTIDLSKVFKSPDGLAIAKSISLNSNTDLVTATVVGDNLSLEFKPGTLGFANIGIRGGTGDRSVSTEFIVKVGPATGTITIREYHNISGSSIGQIKNYNKLISPNPNFPNAIEKGEPSFEGVATKFEWPPGSDPDDPNSKPPGDVRNNYGWQAIGYLHPPETGAYKFYVATDDNSELYLSTDESPENSVRIVTEPSWSGVRDYNNQGENSNDIQLVSGKRYYIEIIVKEGGGGDNMAVAWKMPSDQSGPANGSAPIAGKYLEIWDNKTNDKVAPVITLRTPNGEDGEVITHEAGTDYVDLGAIASDESDGVLTASVVVSNPVDTGKLGEYTVTYNVQDAAGNFSDEVTRTVKVVDTTAPTITLEGDATIKLELGDVYTDSGASANDSLEGALVLIKTGEVDTSKIGEYVISYDVKDSSENAATTVTRTVIVGDTGAPVISLIGLGTITHEAGTNYTDQGATALDTVDGTLTVSSVTTVNTDVVGSYSVTYSVSDANGNAALQVVRTVTVSDTTSPTITLKGEADITIESGQSYSDAGASATDSVDGDLSQLIQTVNPVNSDGVGVYTIIYNVSDKAGNAANQITRTVKVEAKKVEKVQLAIVSYEPAKDATGVDLTAPIKINFNKEISQGSGLIVLNYFLTGIDEKGESTSINIEDADQILITGNSITITPKSGILKPGLKNTIHIENGVIQDLEGTAFEGTPESDYIFTASTIKPGVPSNIIADASDGRATVTWIAPVSDGGSEISSYTVVGVPQFEGGQEVTGTWNNGDGELSIQLEGLENGKDYVFKVLASNSVGVGEKSDPSQIVTPTARKWHWAHPKFANNSNTPVGKASSGTFPIGKADSKGNVMVTWQSDAGVNGNFRTSAGSWTSPMTEQKFQGAAIGSFIEYATAQDTTGAFFAGIKSDENTKKAVLQFAMATAPSYEWSEFVTISSVDADAANPKIDTDGKGNIAVLWDEGGKIKLGSKSASTEIWNINTVSPEGVKAANPSIVVDDSGNAISTWQVFKERSLKLEGGINKWIDGHEQIVANYLPAGAGIETVQSQNWQDEGYFSLAASAHYPQVKVDNNGNALAIWRWFNGENYQIMASYRAKIAISDAQIAEPWSSPRSISPRGMDANHATREISGSAIAFDSSGNAQVVWTVVDNGLYRIQTSTLDFRQIPYNGGNISRSTPVTVSQHVDSEGNILSLSNAQLPSITLDIDGTATIAWQQVAPTGISQVLVSRKDAAARGMLLSTGQSANWYWPTLLPWSMPELISRKDEHAFHPTAFGSGDDKNNPIVVWVQKSTDRLFKGTSESALREIAIAEWSYGVPDVSDPKKLVPTSDIWPVASNGDSYMKHFDQYGGNFYKNGVLYNGFSVAKDGPNAVTKKEDLDENKKISTYGSSSWTFYGSQGELVKASVSIPEGDEVTLPRAPDIVILGPSMELISVNMGEELKEEYSLHTILPITGTFTLIVYNPKPSDKYDLHFSRGKNGTTELGSIKSQSTNEWDFTGKKGDSVFLAMEGKFFSESEGIDVTGGNAISHPHIKLFDPSGVLIVESTIIDFLAMSHTELSEDGTYKVECSAKNNGLGGYELYLFSSNPDSLLTSPIQQPGIVKGSILMDEVKSDLLLPKETATWTFDAAVNDDIVISSTGMDTVLSLYDPNNSLIKQHDDRSRFNKNSIIRVKGLEKSGIYTVVIGSSVSSKGGEYTLSLSKPELIFKTTVADSSNETGVPNPIKINVVVITDDKTLATIPVNTSNWSDWPGSIVGDLNTEFGSLTSGYVAPKFELSKYSVLHSENAVFDSESDALYEISDHPFAESGAINIFFLNLPEANRGITFLDQRLYRTNGPVVLLNADVKEDEMVHIQKVGHLIGFEKVSGGGIGASKEYKKLNAPPIKYLSYTHSNLESNLMGKWGTESQFSDNDANSQKSTFSTTLYRQTFSDIFGAWYEWNELDRLHDSGTGEGPDGGTGSNEPPVLADLEDVTVEAGGGAVFTVDFTDEDKRDIHTIKVTTVGNQLSTWGVNILGEGRTSGSIFELTSAKNSAGTIPIKVEISDGSIRVSKEFNFTITVPRPAIGEVFKHDNPDSVAENKLKVGVLMVDSTGGNASFSGRPSTYNEYISPEALGELVFKSKNGLNSFLQEASYGRTSLEGSVIGWGIIDSQTEGSQFDNLKGQKKVQAAVKLLEGQVDLEDALTALDIIVVYTRESISGNRSSHSTLEVDDQIKLEGLPEVSSLKWLLFENGDLELDNGDIPSGPDMVLPSANWAIEFLTQMGIKGKADALFPDSSDINSALVLHSLPEGANPYSIMGSPHWAVHPDLGMKISLGWLKDGEFSQVNKDGDYRISTLESAINLSVDGVPDFKGAVIELPFPYTFSNKSGEKIETKRLFVEYRDATGFDSILESKLEDSEQLNTYTSLETVNRRGLLVYASYPDSNNGSALQSTVLLDIHPGTPLTEVSASNTMYRAFGELSDAFLNLNEEFTLKNPDAGESVEDLVITVSSLADDFSWIEFSVSGIESQSSDQGRAIAKMSGSGASSGGLKTLLITKDIDITSSEDNSLWLKFDQAWVPSGSQKAVINVSYDGGALIEVARFESNTESLFYKKSAVDETITFPLNNPSSAEKMKIHFAYLDADDDEFWAIDNIRVIPGESYKGMGLEYKEGDYYALIAKGDVEDFSGTLEWQSMSFANEKNYSSYLFRFPTAKDSRDYIEIGELEIITDDVTKGSGGAEPSGRPPLNNDTFDKIDDFHMVAIQGSSGKHGSIGAGYWHNLSFDAISNSSKKFILELPSGVDVKTFEAGLPDVYKSFVSDLNNMKNNAFLTRIWDTDLERYMRFYNMGGRDEVVSFSDNYWGTDSPILVEAMIYDFNEDFNRGPIFYEPVLKTASPKMYPFVEDITISTDSITDQSLRSGAPKQVSTERVTFSIKYNRAMDTNIDPTVHFGPAPPYTDNTVLAVDGGWQSSKEWTGEFAINPGTGDGFQMMHVYGGAAADDAWLVPARDEGRFRFQILSVGAASLTLKVVGHEGYNDVNWLQDDFETLAGYNLYRSNSEEGEYKRINDSLISSKSNRFIDSAVEPGREYHYKFTVVQTDQRESSFSNSSSAISKDTILPVITHESRKTATANMPLTLFAEASDNVSVQSVNLLYRRIGNTDFTSIQMKNTTGQRYSASIVASDVVLPGVEYYLEASDGIGVSSSGLAVSPYRVEAVDAPFITSTSPIIGPGTGGTRVTITGGNFVTETLVYFGDELALDVVVEGRTKITCTTPNHFADTVNILLENPGQKQFSLPRAFTFESTEARVRIPDQISPQFARVVVPIRASNISGLTASDFNVNYDPYVLTPVDISTGEKFSDWNLVSNIDTLSDLKYKLVNHLTFDETFMDSSGRGNHAFRDINYDNWNFQADRGGIFTKEIEGQKYSFGNLDFVEGKVGSHSIGGNFRTTDYVSLGRPDDLNLSNDVDFSMSVWMKTTGTILESTAPAIFSNDYLTLRTLKSKKEGEITSVDWVLVGAGGGRASGETMEGPDIDDHEWHHIAFIYDRTNKVFTYVDGVKVGEWIVPDKLDITTHLDSAFNLGQIGSGNQSNNLKVHFDDLAIWRRAINPSEVTTIFNAGIAGHDISSAGGAMQHKESKTLSVSLASNGGSFTGSGNLVNVEFLVIGKAGTKSPLYASGISVKEFTGITGGSIRDLGSSPKFPDKPDFSGKALYMEWPPGDSLGGLPPESYKDNYGVQLLGYLHPPTTGEYRFFISSDDNGELYLSTDESTENKKLIASEPNWNNRRDWISSYNRYKVGPKVDNNEWHQIAISRTKGGNVSLYFDGQKVGTGSAKNLVDLSNNDFKLVLNQDGTGGYYAHSVASYDDLGIWTRALTDQDIEKLYTNGQIGNALNSEAVGLSSSLVAHLGFDEILEDSTGNANSGILANSAVDVSVPGDIIVATSDNSPSGETVQYAIDDNPRTKYLNYDKLNAGFTITLANPTALTGLGLTSANDRYVRDPATYKLSGSNDPVDSGFELVSEGKVPEFSARFQRREIRFEEKSKFYKYYKITFPSVVDASSANSVQIGEVQFLGAEGEIKFVEGKIGSKGLNFDSGEYMEFDGDGTGIDFTGDFSVSLWVKTNGWQDDPAIIGNKDWDEGSNQGWMLAFTDDGSFQFNANEIENWNTFNLSAETTRNSNQSAPIFLEQGKAYYIEALMKEGGGKDNLSVTWQMPGDPEPVNQTTKPISGTYLSPWSLDIEGNPITPMQLKDKELSTNIKLSKVLLNEGRINVAINDGSLQVQGGSSISGKIYHWKTLSQVRNTTVRINLSDTKDGSYSTSLVDIKNTGDTGAYAFADLESIVLDPSDPYKKYYTVRPEKTDQAIGISAYDAALVQAHITENLRVGLNQNELLAADVTNNGEITSQDAFFILEHSVGLRPVPFPGAGNVWVFKESQIQINEFLSAKLGQDFKAILIGDVSGNWIGNESLGNDGRIFGPTLQPVSLATVQTGFSSIYNLKTEEQIHRLMIQSGEKKVYGVNMQLSYDESKHTKFTFDSDYAIAVNETIPGVILVGIANGQGLKGDNVLLSIRAKGMGKEDIWLDSITVNEGMYQTGSGATMGSLDADSDGLMDINETEVFHTDPGLRDSDGDSMPDGDEVFSGTDPLDAESVLSINLTEENGIYLLNWESILGIGYTVETTTDLNSIWTKFGDTRWSTGKQMAIPIDPPENLNQSFYRVKINQ